MQSIVLHRHSTDPKYAAWRVKLLAHEPFVLDNEAWRTVAAVFVFTVCDRHSTEESKASTSRRSVIDGVRLRLSERNTPALFGAKLIDNISERVLNQVALGTDEKASGHHRPRAAVDRRQAWPLWLARSGGHAPRFRSQRVCDGAWAVGARSRAGRQPHRRRASIQRSRESKKPEPRVDLDATQVGELEAFVNSLKRPVSEAARAMTVLVGETVFANIGCAACHQERIARINGIYSDLLLHDMGPELSDPAPAVSPNQRRSFGSGYGGGSISIASTANVSELQREWRTPPLWGVRDSAPYLHDGRAATLEEAIAWHGGEAEESVEKFNDLLVTDRASLVAFLNTLVAP